MALARRSFRCLLLACLATVASACLGASCDYAAAAATDPLFVFSPTPPPPPGLAVPPPNGYLNGPCGVAVGASGDFYLADYYHDTVDRYEGTADYNSPPVYGSRGYLGQLKAPSPLGGPCGLAIGGGGELYVNEYHRGVAAYGPAPGFAPGPVLSGAGVDAEHPTGVAVDPASGNVFIDERTYVGVYDAAGEPVEEGGQPVRIGAGTLADGYGAAVSAYPATAGYVYVPDAASNTVKVYDPAADKVNPVASIGGPPGGFSSLSEAAVAVDRVTGEVYVTDDLQPVDTETPHGLVDAFDSTGAYEGHLKYEVVLGGPSGLAVDNSATATQGRVYVTSGNTHLGGVYAYPPSAATTAIPLIGTAPPIPVAADSLFPAVAVGEAAGGAGLEIACEGDSCQILPPQPEDPPLGSLAAGKGNPPVRYRRYASGHRSRKRHRRHRRRRGGAAGASTAAAAGPAATTRPLASQVPSSGYGVSNAVASPPRVASLPPLPAGFSASVVADGGAPATLAGSHPYALRMGLGLEQGSGEADLRQLRVDLPTDLLLDPAATGLCSEASLRAPRSSPFEASASGESCPPRSQVGTIEAERSGEVRRFGLFETQPQDGVAASFGAAPFGSQLLLDARLVEEADGAVHVSLESSEVPQGLALRGLGISFWGVPWDASHNGERGNCLNETEPGFPWAKCSAMEEPLLDPPVAFLTLPTRCGGPLAFSGRAETWSGPAVTLEALNGETGSGPALLDGCDTLAFDPGVGGALATKRVSSPSGFAFRLTSADPGFVNPRRRAEARAQSAVVQLPAGVTLNPSLGGGLVGCAPSQLAAASPRAAGCPNGAKIGDVSLSLPFYKGAIKGGVYLAKPYDNDYGSLLAVYLIAKAPDRGILAIAKGKLTPDPGDGTLTARFDGLTELPYSELKVEFRSGQRAPLVSPPDCGAPVTRFELTSWSQATARPVETESPLEAGIEGAACPTGTPPFAPAVSAGAVNSNAGSYTAYDIHLSRRDNEQEITSYSLVLPAGITGKLAGIPFCPDAAIAAARGRKGFDEAADPSCPAASQVGRTSTGYGVGPSLAYSDGRVYLAGPYNGAPLSLVTINPATVGPFDLGTIVVRSAFDLDPLTAQLRIDSSRSDPIPHILDGVVLHVRDIRVYLDRSEFTHNPTSCEPSQLSSTVTGSGASFSTSSDDSSATVSERFQLLNCRTLGFEPKLGLRLLGSPKRGGFPALRATFASRGARDANLRRIEVDIPHQLFLAQNHVRAVCTRVQFAAGACPAGSVYGDAVAYTPLLDAPLRGKVYLRSSQNRLPDLVADLSSGSIQIVLEGRIGPSKQGGISVYFGALPDAPITRFTMLLRGGRHGLLTNSVDICRRPPRASVKALGQNNVGAIFTSTLRGRCHGSGSRSHRRRGGAGR